MVERGLIHGDRLLVTYFNGNIWTSSLIWLMMQIFHRLSSSIEVKGQIISEDVQKYPNIPQGGPKFAKIL